MSTTPRVLIIGAGFAGLSAARELQMAGFDIEIIEARDRIGGRAWTEDRMGCAIELGATWVHWFQPHMWAEISRYNQSVYPSPVTDEAYWITDGELKKGTEAEIDEKLQRPQNKIFENALEFFPNPYEPLAILDDTENFSEDLRQKFLEADQKSPLDILRESGDFTQEEIDLCSSYWSAGYIGSPETASSLMAKQWAGLSDGQLPLLDAQTLRYKLTEGMRGIYTRMAEDLRCPIRLSAPVVAVDHDAQSARVTLVNGEVLEADVVIVTVPVGALGNIEFSPALSAPVQKVIEDKWNTTGYKMWVKIQGHHNIFGYAPYPSKAAMMRSEYFLEDDTTVAVVFGAHHDKVDLNSVESAQEIVNMWRPDLEVVDVTGHDWCADQWSGQAWATLRKGQFTDGWHHFGETGTRMYFAGADWAKGWRGVVVDGALETGISTARKIIDQLR